MPDFSLAGITFPGTLMTCIKVLLRQRKGPRTLWEIVLEVGLEIRARHSLGLDSVSYHQASATEKPQDLRFVAVEWTVPLLILAATQAAEPFLNIISLMLRRRATVLRSTLTQGSQGAGTLPCSPACDKQTQMHTLC